MLEGLVAWVLNTYLGEYVENLNTDQLSIGIFQGNAELESLPLKKTALKSIGLPLEVKTGLIGKITLQIPLGRLDKEWIITIEDLFIVAGPDENMEYDSEAEEKLLADRKNLQLSELEENFNLQKQYLQQGGADSSNWSWWSYGTSFITNIIDNFQIKILNVNLRYEDFTSKGRPFACGMFIQRISAQSCSADWIPGYRYRGSDTNIFKIIELQNFSIYWDCHTEHYTGNSSKSDFQDFFTYELNEVEGKQCFLLSPVSGVCKFTRNTSSLPLRKRDSPRIFLDICLDEFPLSLNDLQFKQMHFALKSYDLACKAYRYKKFKRDSFCKNAKSRWRFALDCVLSTVKERLKNSTRKFILNRAKNNVLYIRMYSLKLTVGLRNMTKSNRDFIDAFEAETPIEELKILRSLVTNSILEKEKQLLSSKSPDLSPVNTPTNYYYGYNILKGWFPGWGGWYGSSTDVKQEITQSPVDSDTSFPSKQNITSGNKLPSSEFDDDLTSLLGRESADNSFMLMDVVFLKVAFTLKSGSLKLFATAGDTDQSDQGLTEDVTFLHPLLELESRDIKTTFESRTRVEGWMIEVSMLDFSLLDKHTKNSIRPILVSPLHKSDHKIKIDGKDPLQLFQFCLEKNPFSTKSNYKLCISSEPLDIVYNPFFLEKVKDIFEVEDDKNFELDIAVVAKMRYEVLKRQTKHELQHTIEALLKGNSQSSLSSWIIKLDLCAPHVTILEDLCKPDATAVVFDLGRLCINNKGPVENQGDSEDDELFLTPSSTPQNVEMIPTTISESLIHEKLYDTYTVELMDLKVFVGSLEENWKAVYLDRLSPWHVVNKFSISLQLERRIIGSHCVDWPNVIINGHIPTIDFHINEFKLTTLKRCLQSLSDDMNKLFGGRKGSVQTQTFCADSVLDSHNSVGNELKEEIKLLSMNFSIHNLSIDVHGKGQCIGQLRISQVSSLLEMTSCRTNIIFSVSSLIVADALQTFGPDYELLVASHANFKNIVLINETQSSTKHKNDANFCEDQQNEALIQLAIEIKGKSFLVNDEDPHYDVNFHFNSLDVIANQKTIVELIAFFQPIFPNDSVKECSGSSYDFSLKTIKRIRIRSKFERLNVLLLSFEHEEANKIALVTFDDAQIDVEAGHFLELSGCLGGFQLENLRQGYRGESVLVQCGTLSESSPLHFQSLNDFSLTGSSLDLEPAFKFNMVFLMDSRTKSHQHCKLFEAFERSDSATKIRQLFLRCSNLPTLNLWKNFYHFYTENKPFTMMALKMASIKYVHSPEFVLELSRCLDNFKMYITRLGSSLSSAATELAAGLVSNEGNKAGDVDNVSSLKKKMKLNIDRKRVVMKDFIDNGLDAQETKLNDDGVGLSKGSLNKSLMFAIVIESPVLMFPKEADSNEVLSVHLGTMSFSNVADQPSELSVDTNQTLVVEFSNMCLYSLDLNKKLNAHSGLNIFGFPILHDTGFKVIINVSDEIPCDPLIYELSNLSQLDISSSNKYVMVTGQLSPLKVVFTRAVLQQMLKTLDNISPAKEKASEINSDVRPPSDSNSHFESSLHLDEEIFQEEEKQNLSKIVKASISMPLFEVLFKGGDGNDDIVKLTLQFLSLDLLNYSRFTISEIKLDSLLMEGLLGDQPRVLMASYGFQKQNKKSSSKYSADGEYLSKSCPSGNDDLLIPDLPPSLPSTLYYHFYASPRVDSDVGVNSRAQNCVNFSDSCLVFLKIIKVSKESVLQKCADYKVTIDFNRLETFIHLETWVLLLEVLGMSGKAQDPNLFSKIPQKDDRNAIIEDGNIDITLKVHELSVVADKKAYELARFNISNFVCNILKTKHELKLRGQLGSMSILDCSPAGTLYSERFQTTGKTALSFNVLKFSTPDCDNSREFDAHIQLEMSSVHYIHTHHFFQEMSAYIQNFNQFQEILNRSRAASEGCKVTEQASSNVRIKLDVNAGAPVLFIPMSSKNVEVLVLDFGKLKIQNQFLYSGYKENTLLDTELVGNTSTDESCHVASDPIRIVQNDRQQSALSTLFSSLGIHGSSSTFLGSHQQTNETFSPYLRKSMKINKKHERTKDDNACLLDVIDVSLFDVEVLSANWFEGRGDPENDFVFSNFTLKRQSHKILKEKCHLHLCVERNLDGDFNKSVSDLSIKAQLSSVQMSLNSHQYKLIRGLLAHNFGEQLAEFQYQLMSHLKDPKTHTVLSGESHVSLSIDIDLDNVQIELVHSETPLLQTNGGTKMQPKEVPLALFDLVKSNLHFESMSDQSKDIGLVCQEINFVDTRYIDSPANLRPNVFSGILKSSESKDGKESLRLEVRWRMNKECEKYHVLLNNMRLMGIFDWLLATKNFLQSSPEDPFVKEKTRDPKFSGMSSTCQGSILTKRISVNDLEPKRKFEFTLNMCNTELVVVEDSRERDTNAVIIKGTTVIVYKPDSERPLSCSLQNVEVYSCCMAAEDETALSIIDPMLLTLELNNTVVDKNSRRSIGLLEATPKERRVMPVLEVGFNVLSVRLSYNDIKLFVAIIDSMPKQVLQANRASQSMNFVSDPMLTKLQEFGFSREDCQEALLMCKGSLDDAVVWLNSHAIPLSNTSSFQPLLCNISGFELKEGSISVCLIDDCLDADVPLMELIVSDIYILYTIVPHVQGRAQFKLYGDYYNRSLSGWEPFIEKWGCNLEWHKDVINDDRNLYMDVKASSPSGIFNVNITRTLIDLYSKTMAKWMSDFNSDTHYNSRRRIPFIPYALRNQVGCDVQFATVSSSPSRYLNESFDEDSRTSCVWRKVTSGTEMSFLVAERDKIRHKDSHDLTVHQIALKVDGWKDISPVSIDKVGTYFRHADPDIDRTSKIFQVKPCARLVFDVAIEGSAKKIVTVRSALLINNMLKDHIEIKLESLLSAKVNIMRVKPYSKSPVPINFVFSKMWVRPLKSMVDWCVTPINWQGVTSFGDGSNFSNVCCSMTNGEECYRFCVSIKRQDFPPDENFIRFGSSSPSSPHPSSRIAQPGHVITILAPLRIENLLPIEMTCALKHVGSSWQPRISVKPGKIVSVLEVDLCKDLGFNVALESFSKCQDFVIPVGTYDNKILLVVCDNQDRPLTLNVTIKAGLGGALKVSVSAPYWLVNKSGLPLIFKQHESNLAAGQFAEHEIARSVTPLLFSFSDKSLFELCTMRVGNFLHHEGSTPTWCPRFMLERGVTVRQVRVAQPSRPDWVYNIGIEVHLGKGRYSDTSIVTFTPRYQLDNRTSYKLAFAQRHQTLKQDVSSKSLCALPNCVLPFHWPRVDLDTLLCVRVLDHTKCHWSGGFLIDKVDSFHINMRSFTNNCFFVHVDVILVGATFFVVFTDATSMPPPYRIDNFAEVPIIFHQSNVEGQRFHTCVKPKTSIPYAWDEPTLPGNITVRVPSGTSSSYDLKKLGDSDRLCYENFIYIAFSSTFKSRHQAWNETSAQDSPNQELVLDVVSPGIVVLKRKEAGKRSQLWRMTSKGLLEHEGSSAPKEPGRKKASSFSSSSSFSSLSSTSTVYVLDIKDIALQPMKEMALTIRKPDEKRVSTQTWKFIDGYLCCGDRRNLCLQVRDGQEGLRNGAEVILGPRKMSDGAVLPEMSIHREKLQPGSGFLCVKVLNDGPTRVLQITDVLHQSYEGQTVNEWVVVQEKRKKPILKTNIQDVTEDKNGKSLLQDLKLEVSVDLPGFGISLVDETPQELLYIFLKIVRIECSISQTDQILQVDVKDFQIDNQCHGSQRPVLLFASPSNKKVSDSDGKPVLHICAHKVSSHSWNAQIFKQFLISVKPINIQIEEKMLWRLLLFLQINQDADIDISECQFASARSSMVATLPEFKRYYFEMFKIFQCSISLSVLTADDLTPDLKIIKRSLRIPLIRFEDAQVELDTFMKCHLFETLNFLMESIRLHYTSEMLGQAAKILGSVDFLGNPLGLFSDMAEGVQCLLQGNVGGLLKNVTKGATNSVAKVSGTLSDTVGKATMDKNHQVQRQQILQKCRNGGADHLKAGINSFWHGLYGAVVSIPTQAYHGAAESGLTGFASGLAKGVVGTLTKPVAGVLDLTSGAANTLRDSSKGYYYKQPCRIREPRCCYGRCGLLPPYSAYHAEAQNFLFQQNHSIHAEMFVARYKLQMGNENESVQVLISNRKIYFMKNMNDVILQVSYESLIGCHWMAKEDKCYIKVIMKDDATNALLTGDAKKSPLVRCDCESIAEEVVQHIRYAKSLYNEMKQTLPVDQSGDEWTT